MSGVLDGLFKNLEDTFESSVKKIETAGESADRVADGVEKLVSSFDEHETAWRSSIKAIRQQLKHGFDHVKDQLMEADKGA